MGRITDDNRRAFLKGVTGTVCAGAATSLFPQMQLLGSALAASPKGGGAGYKALVCVYLDGGSDSFNLLVPRDGTSAVPGPLHAAYNVARGGVYNATNNADGLAFNWQNTNATSFDGLIPINNASAAPNNFALGVHPRCADYIAPAGTGGAGTNHRGLQYLFDQARLAFVANVGTLVAPITKTQYNANSVAKPPQLYSHSDQTSQWNMGRTESNFPYGWGGQVANKVTLAGNGLPSLSPCISIAGSNRFQIGRTDLGQPITPYQMSTGGAQQLCNYGAGGASPQPCGSSFQAVNRRLALDDLLNTTYTHPFSEEYRKILDRSLDLSTTLQGALTSAAGYGRITTPYQYTSGQTYNPANNQYPSTQITLNGTNYSNSLLDQLRMVARMIKVSRTAAAGVNAERQIYFVRIGGFDTHGDSANPQMATNQQPLLMARLSQALGWFWQAMNEITAQNDVTVFTMSEFGRTLNSNGNGSDHAWGGVQLTMGGAVVGQRVYGRYPTLNLNANDDANQNWSFSRGQFIPTTAVDQMAGTFARWMGTPTGDVSTIFPNLANFGGIGGLLPLLP